MSNINQPIPLKIAGIGRYLPPRVVPSHEIEARCNLPAGWAEQRNGVRERRWAEEEETNSFMAAQATWEALDNAGLTLQDIDLIINASGTTEQAIPDGGPLLQRQLGLASSGLPCFSVHATCLSFLRAMDLAASLLMTHSYQHILITAADIASCGINFDDPISACLFGDAAAAIIVSRTPPHEASCLMTSHFETYGEGAYYTAINGGGSRRHPNKPETTPEDNLFTMHGTSILLLLYRYSKPFLENLRPGLSQGLGSIKLVVPHQASKSGMNLMHSFGWPDEQIMKTLDWLGNCVSASTPSTLYEAIKQGRLQRGDEFLMVCTGAGLSIGGLILVY